ncbi:hypothetical protein [Pseudomonas plecoglossicida]|uniref:hypothetical protein n=1 Tax=Pseudomonas plecoglossicida TaxID=70775 RepID=UPI00157B327D|nr:hypothetical protein [Pseudomonas plecoglossicida]
MIGLALKNRDERSIFLVAGNRDARYGSPKSTVNPVVGFGDSNYLRRNSAPITIAGAFFMPAASCYGGCAWETFVSAGFLGYRFANLRTAATHNRLATVRGSSNTQGARPMHALNPSEISREHQNAYCSKLLKTLLRYSTPSELSRITANLEGEVAKTLATRFVPGLNDASYEVYRSFWLKGGAQ